MHYLHTLLVLRPFPIGLVLLAYLLFLLVTYGLFTIYCTWSCKRSLHSFGWPEMETCEWCGAHVPLDEQR